MNIKKEMHIMTKENLHGDGHQNLAPNSVSFNGSTHRDSSFHRQTYETAMGLPIVDHFRSLASDNKNTIHHLSITDCCHVCRNYATRSN